QHEHVASPLEPRANSRDVVRAEGLRRTDDHRDLAPLERVFLAWKRRIDFDRIVVVLAEARSELAEAPRAAVLEALFAMAGREADARARVAHHLAQRQGEALLELRTRPRLVAIVDQLVGRKKERLTLGARHDDDGVGDDDAFFGSARLDPVLLLDGHELGR